MSCFRFIVAEKTNHPISLMCRVLGVSRSGFHAWEQRAPSERALVDARLSERIHEMYARSRDSYGARRIYLDLRDENVRVGRKRVERLMRAAGLSGYVKRRKFRTTFGVPGVRVADDLVERDFNPPAPNRLWASDIKYVSTWEGTLYLASVIDCFSRKVVGWSMRSDIQAELVVDGGLSGPTGGVVRMSCWSSRDCSSPVPVPVRADRGVAHSPGPFRPE